MIEILGVAILVSITAVLIQSVFWIASNFTTAIKKEIDNGQ